MTANNDDDDANINNNNSKCPKCSSNMVQHPSLLSMPLTSSSRQQQNAGEDTKKEYRRSRCKFPFQIHLMRKMWIQ
jgi:hypothetical protein